MAKIVILHCWRMTPLRYFAPVPVRGGDLRKLNGAVAAGDTQPATGKKLFFRCRVIMLDMRKDPGPCAMDTSTDWEARRLQLPSHHRFRARG
jgi:hypothetical protein